MLNTTRIEYPVAVEVVTPLFSGFIKLHALHDHTIIVFPFSNCFHQQNPFTLRSLVLEADTLGIAALLFLSYPSLSFPQLHSITMRLSQLVFFAGLSIAVVGQGYVINYSNSILAIRYIQNDIDTAQSLLLLLNLQRVSSI